MSIGQGAKHAIMDIAIVIPCYNAEPYLAQSIGSALEQTHKPRQIVIVDDGSTDASLAIARRFEAAFPAVIRVHSERSGSAARTRNIGAALAEGEALMFLDADDVLAPNALAALAGALKFEPAALAACPWRRLDLKDGRWLSSAASCAPRKPGQDALSAWLTGWYYPPCAVLWSREAFRQVGGWDENATVNDDGDLVMRALAWDIPLVETAEGVAYYRRLPAGETSLSGTQQTYGGLLGRMAVLEKIARLLEERGRLGPYRQPLNQAFALIGTDAAGRFAGIAEQARANRWHYGPAVTRRVLNRLADPLKRTAGPGSRPSAAPPRDQPEEIRFGLAQAQSVLETNKPDTASRSGTLSAEQGRPDVTVVIPVYNRADLLPRTLGSVLAQTFEDFEVLVVDDCSEDDPGAVIAAMGDARLRHVRQPVNRGVAAARNRGLREARGRLIAFLDDDDEWFPEKLAEQVALFDRSSPDVGLIYTGVETLEEGGKRTYQIPSARGDLYRELLARNILHGVPASGMIRRNVVATVGFFDETLPAIEDYDYWLRICRHFKVECLAQPLVRYNDYQTQTGPENEQRRSRNVAANLAAREQFYRKHGDQMRRAGVAHLFLADSARRHLAAGGRHTRGALKLFLRALRIAPMSWEVRSLAIRMIGAAGLRSRLTAGRGMAGAVSTAKGTR